MQTVLADAADQGLVLTTDALTALGVKGINGLADGDEAFGDRFRKHSQHNRTLWTVERSLLPKLPDHSSDDEPDELQADQESEGSFTPGD